MTKLFGDMTTEGLEETSDRIGGGRQLFETNTYEATIKLAYAGEATAPSKARSVTILFDIGGQEYRETFWVAGREGLHYYMTKSDTPKKAQLGGFATVDEICLVTTGKGLSEQDAEERQVNVWDNTVRKEVPQARMCLIELHDQVVRLAIQKQQVNKQEKDSNNQYYDVAESREQNEIVKVFEHASKMTVPEARRVQKGEELGTLFFDTWTERNRGKDYDKRSIKDGGTAGKPSQAPAAGAGGERKSLFGAKTN